MSEVQQLRDRIEQLESALGVDRGLTGQIRDTLKLEPLPAKCAGMLLRREFVTRTGLYGVLYGERPDCEWPAPKQLDVHLCKLREALEPFGIHIETRWGEGWLMTQAEKAKLMALISVPEPVTAH